MEDAFATIGAMVLFGGIIVFLINGCSQAKRSIGRTSKAVGKWNDEQLKKK